MNPHLLDLSAGDGRLLPSNHICGDCDGDQYGCNHACPDYVAGPFGEFLAAGGIIESFG
jgi:hypothetical protein